MHPGDEVKVRDIEHKLAGLQGINGRDVAGATPTEGTADSCRLYGDARDGFTGVPATTDIADALRHGSGPAVERSRNGGRFEWSRLLPSVPGVGAALMPVGACPACWPAYAGVIGSLGLGFLLESVFVLPITIGFLGLALFALAFRAQSRRGFGPVAVGLAAAAVVLVFKFVYPAGRLVDAGLFGLVAASAWNAWPKRRREIATCAKCVPQDLSTERTRTP